MVHNLFPLSLGQLVLDITIGMTLLSIFPTAASVQLGKQQNITDHDDKYAFHG